MGTQEWSTDKVCAFFTRWGSCPGRLARLIMPVRKPSSRPRTSPIRCQSSGTGLKKQHWTGQYGGQNKARWRIDRGVEAQRFTSKTKASIRASRSEEAILWSVGRSDHPVVVTFSAVGWWRSGCQAAAYSALWSFPDQVTVANSQAVGLCNVNKYPTITMMPWPYQGQ